jgi:hypothetical protein
MFFLCFGIVVVELGLEALIRRSIEWINCTMDKNKAAIIAKNPTPIASAPPDNNSYQASAPPLVNNQFTPSKLIAPEPSAPPDNNSNQASAPPINNP